MCLLILLNSTPCEKFHYSQPCALATPFYYTLKKKRFSETILYFSSFFFLPLLLFFFFFLSQKSFPVFLFLSLWSDQLFSRTRMLASLVTYKTLIQLVLEQLDQKHARRFNSKIYNFPRFSASETAPSLEMNALL